MAITPHDEEKIPLLQETDPAKKNLIQQAITQTFQSTAHLANLLPTGTVLTFQLLSPIFSNQGNCDPVSRSMTAVLIVLCGLSCLVLSFSDSYRDDNGNICYGFATYRGLWVIDGSTNLQPELALNYRIRLLDFVHGLLSVFVFVAIAMFDANVVHCFYPQPSVEAEELLSSLPIGIGVICSMLFVVFPTQRHGIGFPLSSS
ncbi:hypothetical protein V2J09_002792 [Rumex salicifolius]